MKIIVLFIAVVFSGGIALANDAAAAPGVKKTELLNTKSSSFGEGKGKSGALGWPSEGNVSRGGIDHVAAAGFQHSRAPGAFGKAALPVNAGRQHGTASIGGAASGQKGMLNGTEVRRAP